MKAAVLLDEECIEVRDWPQPELKEGWVVVAPAFASICGTDAHIYKGEFKGRVTYPRVLGHEISGVVAEVGPGVTGVEVGQRVVVDPINPCGVCPACIDGRMSGCLNMKLTGVDVDGGFAELVTTLAKKVHPIPDLLSLKYAAMCEIYTIGVHAMRRTRPEPADTVVILGAGRLGLAILEVLRQTAVGTIIITDIKDYRLKVAGKLGADFTVNVLQKDPVEEVMRITDGRGADKVLEAVGTAKLGKSGKQPMTEAAEMIRPAGRIIVLGQGSEEEPIFWRRFVWKEAEIVASRVSQGEFPRTISMFSRGLFNPELLITHTLPLDEAKRAFELVESETEEVIKIMFEIGGEK